MDEAKKQKTKFHHKEHREHEGWTLRENYLFPRLFAVAT
jgi:hypothetical protein